MKKISAVFMFVVVGVMTFSSSVAYAAVLPTSLNILGSPLTTIDYGQTINLTARLRQTSGGVITGKPVVFLLDSNPIAIVNTNASGDAVATNMVVPTAIRNVGTHNNVVRVRFLADGTYGASTAVQDLIVNAIPLSITAQSQTKDYDGTVASIGAPFVSSGSLKYSDTLNFIQQFLTKIVGMNKTIVPTGSVSDGNSGNNYTVTTINSTTGRIKRIPLSISGITGVSKMYDGNNSASVNTGSATLTGVIPGDNVSLDFTAMVTTFSNKIVGVGKTITITGVILTGSDAANYTLSPITGVTANITPAPLIITGTTVSHKEYDATNIGTVVTSGSMLSGVIGLDAVTLGTAAMGIFDTKHIGTAKHVTITGFTLSGTDALNYELSQPTGVTADVTAKDISVSFNADNKIYDGLLAATGTFSDTRIPGDSLVISNTGINFDTKVIGVNKTVTVSGISLSGTDALNYHLVNTTVTDTANITTRILVLTVTGTDKVYDSNRQAVVSLTDNRVPADDITVSYLQSRFGTKNVGPHKNVTVTGISLSGTDALNYTTASSAQDLDVAITPRPLAVTATINNKVYDGNVTAGVVSLTDDRIIGDNVGTISSTLATFGTKDVGTAKAAVVNILISSAPDNVNYSIPALVSASADITPRTLTVTAVGDNKIYDTTTTASAILSDNRVSGDVLTSAYTSALFDTSSVGNGKIVTIIGISLSGTDAGNYLVAPTTISTTGNITQKPIIITANNLSKELNQTDPILTATVVGVISPDITTGILVRDAGETIGAYVINQGTFTAGGNYLETFIPGVFTITKKSQTITIDPIFAKNFGDSDFGITGTASSNLAPIFSLDITSAGICSLVAPSVVHILNLGNCTVLADQSGDSEYFAAPSASMIVPIIDATGPTITLVGLNPVTVEVQTGTYVEAGATASDNHYSGSPAVTISGSVDIMTVGSYLISYSSTDDHRNTTTITRTINVVDTIKPVITLIGSSSVTIIAGDIYVDAGATASDVYNGTIIPTSTSTVNTAVEGTYTVSYDAQDASSNIADAVIRTVHVVNADAPVFSLSNITQEATSSSGNVIDYGTITSIDAIDGIISASCTPITNSTFIVGVTTVQCQSINSHSITGSGSFTVTVTDTTAPVITVPGTQTFEATGIATTPTLITATAADIVDGSITATTSATMFTKGTHTVTWTATDAHANVATATSTVVITDTTAPVISRNGNATIALAYGALYTDLGATAVDMVDGTVTVVVGGDIVNTTVPGTYTVRYNAADASLNTAAEVTRTVVVNAPISSGGGSSGSLLIIPLPKIDGGSTTTPEVLGVATFKFTCDISYKRKIVCDNNDVTELQKVLKREKLYKGKIHGLYTYQTFLAVKAYQKLYGIEPVSGFIGVKTRAELNK